jgi:hypothetical protein
MLASVRKAIDGRRVVWFGIRGEDAEALLQLPELEASFTVTAQLRSARLASSSNVTLEGLSGARPDLDRHDIDLDTSEAAREFRRRFLVEVSGRCVVVTYRPAAFVSALAFSMTETMTLAGLFKDRQMAFEHKPWVETSLLRRGIPMLGWRYVADEHRSRAKRMLVNGPLVLRGSRSSGGVGMARVTSELEVDILWPPQPDAFVAVAPFVERALPVNVTGCVFPNGVVHAHPPSVQLIGVESCTDRSFGYCGNDFGAISAVDARALDRLDSIVRSVGAWLHSERYVGVFGVDALCRDADVFFTEVNPRFQGSSAPSAEIAAGLDVADLFLEHLAASLGLPAEEPGLSVSDWVREQPALSQIVVHNTSGGSLYRDATSALPSMGRDTRVAQLVPAQVEALPGASTYRIVTARSVTTTGFEIDDLSTRLVDALSARFRSDARPMRTAAGVAS